MGSTPAGPTKGVQVLLYALFFFGVADTFQLFLGLNGFDGEKKFESARRGALMAT